MPDRSRGGEGADVEHARLLPVLHSSKHRQAALRKRDKPTTSHPPNQSQGLGKPPVASQGSGRTLAASQAAEQWQAQSQGPGKLQRGSWGSSTEPGWVAEAPGAIQADEEEDPGLLSVAAQSAGAPQTDAGGDTVPSPPPPLPVRAHPYSHHDDASTAHDRMTQQQRQQQQQQQQHESDQEQYTGPQQNQHGAAAAVDLAQQARRSFERSTSQQQTRGVETGGGRDAGVLLQACLHRFVRPETLHRWTCSRLACDFLSVCWIVTGMTCLGTTRDGV